MVEFAAGGGAAAAGCAAGDIAAADEVGEPGWWAVVLGGDMEPFAEVLAVPRN